jgi:predicted acyl esterase
MKSRRGLLAALAVLVALVVAPSAQAAPASVFGPGAPCTTLPSNGNIRSCSGFALSFDGTKISVNVFLPPESAGAGPYPTIGDFHGWGSAKLGLTNENGGFTQAEDPRIQGWAEHGYAVFSMSDRGWGLSCGALDPGKGLANCAQGYNHLMDDRYEVRDAQVLLGDLADEGIVQPTKIGVTGASYGGGISIALAALRNREMMPSGALVPWESTVGHQKMEIAAAVPQWPWTDIAYALAPNGRNLDYVTNSPYAGPSGKFPVGVWKASWNEYLYGAGLLLSNYNTTLESQANIPAWIQRLKAGDPYTDSSIKGIIKLLTTFHSSYYIDSSVEPSPLLIQSGWNDDLFPVDEALRFYQRTRAQYPSDPISLYLADIGHSRSQNKPADIAAFNQRLNAWFGHYLKGEGAAPSSSVEATTTTCPSSEPSGGPLKATDWSALAPGEVRLQTTGSQTITHRSAAEERSAVENEEFNEKSAVFDPIIGPKIGKTVCSAVPDTEEEGSANYRLGAVPAGGYTLMGSPTIIAQVESPSPNSEIAARLVDVSPAGTETLIARGLYRPDGGNQEIVFQLHPQAYHFAAGHVAKLELLSSDVPYGRYSNLQANVTVSDLELRLPVTESPGSLGGLVQKPAPKVIPPGYTLAAEYAADQNPEGSGGTGGGTTTKPPAPAPVVKIGAGNLAGRLSSSRKFLIVPLSCSGGGKCSGQVSVAAKRPGKKGRATVASGSYSIAADTTTENLRLPLNKVGRTLVEELLAGPHPSKTLNSLLELKDSSRTKSQKSQRAVQLPKAN